MLKSAFQAEPTAGADQEIAQHHGLQRADLAAQASCSATLEHRRAKLTAGEDSMEVSVGNHLKTRQGRFLLEGLSEGIFQLLSAPSPASKTNKNPTTNKMRKPKNASKNSVPSWKNCRKKLPKQKNSSSTSVIPGNSSN
jgi:hypothetical protein